MLDKEQEYFLSEYQKKVKTLTGVDRQKYKQRMISAAYGMNMAISGILEMTSENYEQISNSFKKEQKSKSKLLLLC